MELGDMMHAESPPNAMAFPTVSRWLGLAAAGITPRRELATFLKTEAVPQLLDGGEVAFGRDEQILALAASRNGEIRIAAHDQALTGIVVCRDAGEIALVEQRELEGAGIEQGLDCRCAQRGDPVEIGRLDVLLDTSLRDHAAITDKHHVG